MVSLIGFMAVAGFWVPLRLRASAATASSEFAWALASTAFVFGVLHLGLIREYRKATQRQLPALILVVLVSVFMALGIYSEYRFQSTEFPWEMAAMLPVFILAFGLFPLYGVSLLLAWLLHLVFHVPWRLANSPPAEGK